MKTLLTYILGLGLTLSFVTSGLCQSSLSDEPIMVQSSKNDDKEEGKTSERTSSEKVKEKAEHKKKKKEECKRKEAEEEASISNLYFTTP